MILIKLVLILSLLYENVSSIWNKDKYHDDLKSGNLFGGAFCGKIDHLHSESHSDPMGILHQQQRFDCSTPWVWDAIFNPNQMAIDIVLVPRESCYFNQTRWKRAVELFPREAHHLSYGDSKNVLHQNCSGQTLHYYLINRRVICHFPVSNKGTIKYLMGYSNVITSRREHIGWSPLVITCPLPPQVRADATSEQQLNTIAMMKISIPPQIIEEHQSQQLRSDSHSYFSRNSSSDIGEGREVSFPFCALPDTNRNVSSQSLNETHHLYELAVCSAIGFHSANQTSSALNQRLRQILEWIEYHRLLGVEHFFLYDISSTSSDQPTTTFSDALRQLIDDRLVTLIPWPYQNCIKYQQSTRGVGWIDNNPAYLELHSKQNRTWFKMPGCVAQWSALASCYTRFRETSKYIISIDDDEFVNLRHFNFNSNTTQSNMTNMDMSISRGKLINSDRPLITFIHKAQRDFSPRQLAAIVMKPTHVYRCPRTSQVTRVSTEQIVLPRLDRFMHAFDGYDYEAKLIMATDTVKMFAVHYLFQLQREPLHHLPLKEFVYDTDERSLQQQQQQQQLLRRGRRNQTHHKVHAREITLLHFKDLNAVSIFGRFLPLHPDNFQNEKCHSAQMISLRGMNRTISNDKRNNQPTQRCKHCGIDLDSGLLQQTRLNLQQNSKRIMID